MSTFAVLLKCILIFGFIGYIQGYNTCGLHCLKKNEVFDKCLGLCDKRCDNKNPACPKICHPGCICKCGYLRDPWTGECVLPSECSNVCNGQHEIFSPCSKHCEKTCDNDNPFCTKICKPGCICKEGYVRNTEIGKCVLPAQCPKVCPLNEEYQQCGTMCPITCDNRHNPPKVCGLACVSGCFCVKGYVRDTKSKKCVLPCDCPRCPGHRGESSEKKISHRSCVAPRSKERGHGRHSTERKGSKEKGHGGHSKERKGSKEKRHGGHSKERKGSKEKRHGGHSKERKGSKEKGHGGHSKERKGSKEKGHGHSKEKKGSKEKGHGRHSNEYRSRENCGCY
ncbi:hemocytin-like [Arctopsyche grandis]|uniref:hemocytin-like n=1 Tax=Arctopsyche grandis TaxID=121162 RepID=UPI00406D886C